jgi:uncharacterized protein (TIGR02598 family)
VKIGSPVLPLVRRLWTRDFCLSQAHGFSLIEVAIALGIVSFVLIPIIGLLPMGLATIQASENQTVMAGIAQQIRGQLQEITFSSVATLPQTTYYYTNEGVPTASSSGGYYAVSFTVKGALIPGGGSSTFDNANAAQTVVATMTYPVGAPASSQKTSVFSFLAAKQGTN